MHTGGLLTLVQRHGGTRPALTAMGLWAWTRETPVQARTAVVAASGSGFWSSLHEQGRICTCVSFASRVHVLWCWGYPVLRTLLSLK